MSKDAKLAVLGQIAALAKSAIKKGMNPNGEGEECPICHQEPCECDEAEHEGEEMGLKDPSGDKYGDGFGDEEDPEDNSDKSKLLRFKKKLGKSAAE